MQSSTDVFDEVIKKLHLTGIGDLKDRKNLFLSEKHLDLNNLGISSIENGVFDKLDDIIYLGLSGNSIENLPETIFDNMAQLEILDLSYSLTPKKLDEDELFELPENIFMNLTKLKILDLSGNQLELLPDGIFDKLYALEALNISSNLLAILPASIGNLVNLEELILESNFFPIEFNEEYHGYMETQEFLEPFYQAWSIMNNPLELINKIDIDDVKPEQYDEFSDNLKKAFKSFFNDLE